MGRKRDKKKIKNKTIDKKSTDTITYLISASPLLRIKAFITDMFMIMMPIMYITTYIILDGKESFQNNDISHWITMAIYGFITILFWIKTGQTPGFKAYDLRLVDDHTKKPITFGLSIARYMMFLFSAASIIGILLPFFRKDKKTLQDILMQTSVVHIS
jgi:uncharacterized RDD family membrane protein YckC